LVNANPLLAATAAPPIPEAKRWADAYSGALGPLIDLSQAVPDRPPHPEFLQRLAAAAATPDAASYGPIAGDAELRAAYAAHLSELYGGTIGADRVAITAGCNQAFFVAILALARAGEQVLLPSPWYFNHKMALDMLGIEAAALPCRPEEGFVPDAEAAEPLIGPRTRAIVLVTPSNPTGAIYHPAAIASFVELAAAKGIALVLDETYRDFIDRAPPHELLANAGCEATLVQLYSFSKAYCIPGYRVGALLADASFVAQSEKVLDTLQICAPRLPQLVLPWAISALASWRKANRDDILARAGEFRVVMDELDGWRVRSIGAYFAFVEHPYSGVPAADVCSWLGAERGVLALPGSYFGRNLHAYVRVAFANVDGEAIRALPMRLRADYPRGRQAGLGRTVGGMRL
jgi:aspartate/methionine/tyrosine aminotransferase